MNGQSPLWFFVFPGGELGLRPGGQPVLPVPASLSARGLQSCNQGDVLDLEPGTARVLSPLPTHRPVFSAPPPVPSASRI